MHANPQEATLGVFYQKNPNFASLLSLFPMDPDASPQPNCTRFIGLFVLYNRWERRWNKVFKKVKSCSSKSFMV